MYSEACVPNVRRKINPQNLIESQWRPNKSGVMGLERKVSDKGAADLKFCVCVWGGGMGAEARGGGASGLINSVQTFFFRLTFVRNLVLTFLSWFRGMQTAFSPGLRLLQIICLQIVPP